MCQELFIHYSIKPPNNNIIFPPSTQVDVMDLERAAHTGSPDPSKPWACAERPGSRGGTHWPGAGRGGGRHFWDCGLYRCGRGWGPGTSRGRTLWVFPIFTFPVQMSPLPIWHQFPPIDISPLEALFVTSLSCAESCYAQKGATGMRWESPPLLCTLFPEHPLRACSSPQRPRTWPCWCLCSDCTAFSSQEAHSTKWVWGMPSPCLPEATVWDHFLFLVATPSSNPLVLLGFRSQEIFRSYFIYFICSLVLSFLVVVVVP